MRLLINKHFKLSSSDYDMIINHYNHVIQKEDEDSCSLSLIDQPNLQKPHLSLLNVIKRKNSFITNHRTFLKQLSRRFDIYNFLFYN